MMMTKLWKVTVIIIYGLTIIGLKGLLGTWLLGLLIDWPITWVNVLITSVVIELSLLGAQLVHKSKINV